MTVIYTILRWLILINKYFTCFKSKLTCQRTQIKFGKRGNINYPSLTILLNSEILSKDVIITLWPNILLYFPYKLLKSHKQSCRRHKAIQVSFGFHVCQKCTYFRGARRGLSCVWTNFEKLVNGNVYFNRDLICVDTTS